MLRLIVCALVLVLSTNLAVAHSREHVQCFADQDSLRKVYPVGHAYYIGLKKECWHVHNEKNRVIEAKISKGKVKAVEPKPHPVYAESNEQMLRGYLGLDCDTWFPLPLVVCYTGR